MAAWKSWCCSIIPSFRNSSHLSVIARTVGHLENMEKIWRKDHGTSMARLFYLFWGLLNIATTCYNERIHDVPPPKKNHGTHATGFLLPRPGSSESEEPTIFGSELRSESHWKTHSPRGPAGGFHKGAGVVFFVEILEENWKSSLMSFLRSLIQTNFSQKAV